MTEDRAHQDLALIRAMMEEGRREIVDRGSHFVIWGVISAVGAGLTFAFIQGHPIPNPTWIWIALIVIGWVTSLSVGRREARTARVRTAARRILAVVWIASAVSITLLSLAGMFSPAVSHVALPGMVSVALGAPIYVTMLLTGERRLGLVAAGWWGGGTLMLFLPGPHTLLVLAGMALLLMALPGFVLRGKAQKRNEGPAGEPAPEEL